MQNNKRSKHPRYDDPSAFRQRFPRIEPTTGGTPMAAMMGVKEQVYKMGPVRATLVEPQENAPGYFLSIYGRDRYPTWDEIVWLRYNLIPDAAVMSLILPNLNAYINQEDTQFKFVFTMEQKGWAIDPLPLCPRCQTEMAVGEINMALAQCICPNCDQKVTINLRTWNEDNGNGFRAVKQK